MFKFIRGMASTKKIKVATPDGHRVTTIVGDGDTATEAATATSGAATNAVEGPVVATDRYTPASSGCPFADLREPPDHASAKSRCPFHAHNPIRPTSLPEAPPLVLSSADRFTHQTSEGTARLLADIGGGDRIREMCTRFYARQFGDYTLKPFLFNDDSAEAHGKRLADWIIEKMDADNPAWTLSGRKGQRTPSHVKAWNSIKRAPAERGKRFKLDDTRIWMRLHFWAAREVGLGPEMHAPFWEWYIEFIAHFIAVYERSAPRYALESAMWSGDAKMVAKYIASGNKMTDVIGIGRH